MLNVNIEKTEKIMKFNLNIVDMNEEEFAKIFSSINCNPTIQPVIAVEKEEPVMSEIDTPDVDADGLHWDARIHSSNHKLTSKGVWQRRKGISDDEYNNIRNELLGLQPSIPFEAPAAPVAPVVTVNTPMGEMSAVVAPIPVVAPAPIPAPEPALEPVQAPVAPEVDSAVMLQTIFDKVKNGINDGKVKANDIQNIIATVNAQFGTQYQSLAQVGNNIPVLQFVINDLTVRGL